MTSRIEQDIEQFLLMSGLVEPIKMTQRGAKFTALCRAAKGQEAAAKWLEITKALLTWAEQNDPETVFIAKQYLLKDGNVVFGWYLKFEFGSAKQLKDFVQGPFRMALLARPLSIKSKQSQPTAAPKKKQLKLISRHVDEEGKLHETVEVPLAHVSGDINKPTAPVWSEVHGRMIGGGKGARSVTGGK